MLSCLFAMIFVAAVLVMAAAIFGGRDEETDIGQMSQRNLVLGPEQERPEPRDKG